MFFVMISSTHHPSYAHLVKTPLNMLLIFLLGSVNIITGCDVLSRWLLIIFIAVLKLVSELPNSELELEHFPG